MLGTNQVRRRVHYRSIDRRNRLPSRITFDRAASVTRWNYGRFKDDWDDYDERSGATGDRLTLRGHHPPAVVPADLTLM